MMFKNMLITIFVLSYIGINAQSIHEVVEEGDLQKVKEFIDKNPASVNLYNENSETALHQAAYMGSVGIAEYLIEKGADKNVKGRQGYTPLHYAAFGNRGEMVGLLIKKGVDPNILSERNYTPLHFAVMRSSVEAATELIALGADVDAKDFEGNTPLHTAALTGSQKSIAILIAKNANLNSTNNLGQKPLHMVTEPGTAKILIDSGADVNSTTTSMDTPLHGAVYQGNKEMVELLISEGADVNAKNNKNNTPLFYAIQKGNEEIINLVKSKGGLNTNKINLVKEDLLDMSKKGLTFPVKFTILYDNYTAVEGAKAQWGFSCLISGAEKEILFDTGTLPEILEYNINYLNVDPSKIEKVVLSHNHTDHTGGLFWLLDKNSNIDLYIPDSFPYDFIRKAEEYDIDIHTNINPVEICDNVYLTGELGDRIKEQSLIINKKDGLIIITGCSHPGIVNIVQRAKELFNKKILLVFGGFHLTSQTEEEVHEIINQFRKLGVEKCGATHCTGERAISAFRAAFGDNYVEMGTGREIIIR